MKHLSLLLILIAGFKMTAARAADDYVPGPDSKPQEGVPKGEVLKFSFDQSKIFPGTTRDYWIYVPKQYDPAKPACLWVNQDGIQFAAPVVFDNLIARGEMPVTIGVFIMHGRVPAPNADALDRFNRSYEYDGLGNSYVRFLLEELLPDAEKKTAADGRPIHFSKNPNDRGIGGASSGAICAFTAAWERPDSFRRVFSSVGTFVGLRGGNNYSTLIRKTEPKPIRVFLQDGSNDGNNFGGDWWMANQEIERSLTFAGYEVNHAWGDGGHNSKHATAVFPDALRWLWKDWPAAVKAGGGSQQLKDILIPGEEWKQVGEGYTWSEGPAANEKGEVFFNDLHSGKTYKVNPDGAPSVYISDSRKANGQAFGPDGRMYAVATAEDKVFAYDAAGQRTQIAEGIHGNDIVVLHDGRIYVTAPESGEPNPGKVWFISPSGEKKLVDTGLKYPNGIAVSPDQTLLYVGDYHSHWVYSYQIQPDGSLADKQRYFWLHAPDNMDDSGTDGIRLDRDGRLYVTTYLGIQVCDQAGRVSCIIPTPNGVIANLCFGGKDFDTLYCTCGSKVYSRKVKTRGAPAYQAPLKPAPPKL